MAGRHMLAQKSLALLKKIALSIFSFFLRHQATLIIIRRHSASLNTNTIRMAGNTKTPATKSSGDERPRKRARTSPRATQALNSMQGVFEDQERELEEAKAEIADLKHNGAQQTAELKEIEKEHKGLVYRLNVRLEYKKDEIRLLREENAKDLGNLKATYARLVAAAKAVVGSKLKESGEKIRELEGVLKELGATEESES